MVNKAHTYIHTHTHTHNGKTLGFDGICKEHLVHAGESLIWVLHLAFNWIFTLEYVPTNFRRGIQVPLYKGKNTSTLSVDNYRGITLLSTYNKLFEVIFYAIG